MRTLPESPWSLILAGGDGVRLKSLTRAITGDPRPKQFCPLLDGETLLQRTRRRVDLLTRFDHQAVVVTRAHEEYYRPLLADLAPGRLVAQPDNRGTAAGLLYPLLRIGDLAGDAPLRRALGSSREAYVADRIYATLPSINFSERVLVPSASRLGVVRVKDVEWSDLGNVERVFATIRRNGWHPRWLDQVSLPAAG